MAVITSYAIAVEQYCDQHVCLCVCLCVCLSVCPPAYLRSHTSEIAKFLCMLPMVVARSSSGELTTSQGERGNFWGFSSPLTMHYNAFAANGIGREGGDGSAQRGRTVGLIYDYLVTTVCGFGGFYMRAASASCHRVSCAANATHIEFSIFVAENHFCKQCVTL